jgi:hypothetical protein
MEEAILIVLLKNEYQAREANHITDKMIKYIYDLEYAKESKDKYAI